MSGHVLQADDCMSLVWQNLVSYIMQGSLYSMPSLLLICVIVLVPDEATQQGSVDRTARALDAATASVQPVRGLYSALEGAGAFSGSAAGNPIAVYSSRYAPCHTLSTSIRAECLPHLAQV